MWSDFFNPSESSAWCRAGIWCPIVASILSNYGVRPEELPNDAALLDSVCQGRESVHVLILEAA